jgi:hypothetical protein
MDDPVEWAAWAYGKFGHWGLAAVLGVVIVVIGLVWWRGAEKYQKDHAAQPLHEAQAATVQQVETALAPVRDDRYRSLVADVIHAMEPNAFITVGGAVVGPDGARNVDVQVWSADRQGGPAIIDVIDHSDGTPVDIDALDHAESKRRDLAVRAALISSNSGFTREAISKAKRTGVGLITVLREGDTRASVIEEEVYLRTIQLKKAQSVFKHTGKNRTVGNYDVTYRGFSVDLWLHHRLILAASGFGKDMTGLMLYYRLRQPTDFNAPGGKLRKVTQIGLLVDATVQWASQVVRLNAKNAIYDYTRGTIRFGGPKENSYMIENVNWDTATPLAEPPSVRVLGPGPDQGGDFDMVLMRLQGFPAKVAPSKELDDLIEPEDLKIEFQPLSMKAKP